MSIWEIVAILILGGCGWLWLDSLKARETAVQAARGACDAEGLMLLDETVAISALKMARHANGRVQLQRAYVFDYSDNGNNRLSGSVVLLGHRVVMLNVGVRNAPIIKSLS